MGESRRRSALGRFLVKKETRAAPMVPSGVPIRGSVSLGAEEAQALRDVTNSKDTARRGFTQSYELGRMLGDGAFGEVFECRDKTTGETLACKVMQKGSYQREAERSMVAQEVTALRLCKGRCPGAVQLVEALETEKSIQLVMELCSGDLCDLLRRRGRLPEAAAQLVLGQVATALKFCHSHGLVHRDVKPENIMFDRPAGELYFYTSTTQDTPRVRAKLGDFGLSVELKPGETTCGYAGSVRYAAPEVINGARYGRRADIWSLGVCLYVMLTGKLPFCGKTADDMEGVRKAIAKGKLDFHQPCWADVSEEAKGLVRAMLQVEPAKRITSFDLVHHPWVAAAIPASAPSTPPRAPLPPPPPQPLR